MVERRRAAGSMDTRVLRKRKCPPFTEWQIKNMAIEE
jgi:hypothetical protein